MAKFLAFIIGLGLSIASFAQGYPGARRVTIHASSIKLEDIFRKVYEQTGMTAFYNDEQLNSFEILHADFENEQLDNVLAHLLRRRGLAWCHRRDVFVVAPRRPEDVDLGYIPGEDNRLISGSVVNEKGIPLEAVSVLTGDRSIGMNTGSDGRFWLWEVKPGATLLVQKMGYKPMVLSSFADSIFIQLVPIVAPLQPVQVTGVVQGNLTGSVSQVSSKEITESPVNNVLGALQGKVPGLFLNQTTGLPGGGYRIRLRGRNSIECNSDPLIIVDGIPFPSVSFNENFYNTGTTTGANVAPSPLNLLSVSDIASIRILKDADATALYGTKGANGVILITSKQPDSRDKALKVDVNYYTGIGKASNMVRYLDTRQYLQMRREAIANDGRSADSTLDYDLLKWDTTRYKDWQKVIIGGTSRISDGSLELKGGSGRFAYRTSGIYRQESTVYPSSDFKYSKGGTMAQLWFSPGRGRLTMNFTANYVRDHNRLPLTDITVYSAITPPNAPEPYTADHKLNFAKGNFQNPYAFLLQMTSAVSSSFRPSFNLSWQPVEDLVFSINTGGSSISVKEAQRSPAVSFNPASGIDYGVAQFSDNRYRNGTLDLRANWKKTVAGHQFALTAGARLQFEQQRKRAWYAWGYAADDLLLRDTASATDVMLLDNTKTDYVYQSFYGRVEYKYKDRYLLTFTANRDGSTRLSSPYGNFGAIGMGWVFTREGWWRPGSILSYGKLRASYGSSGNDLFERDMDKAAWVPGQPYSGNPVEHLSTDRPPVHGWEKVRKAEAALDLGLLADKLSATFCYFSNQSTDLLFAGRFQGFSGGATFNRFYPVNVPAVVANKGFEMDLEGQLLSSGAFSWSTNLNLSFVRNRLSYFPALAQSTYRAFYSEGKSLDMVKGFHLTGVDATTGIYRFENLGLSRISFAEDGVFATERGPFFYGGWYNNLKYHSFEISFLLRYTSQRNGSYDYFPGAAAPPGAVGNQPASALDRWQKPGDAAKLQRYTTDYNTPAGIAFARLLSSDAILTDAGYLRLQSLYLAYQFPPKLLSRIRLKSCKLFVQGLNLFTWTSYNGRDPEVSAGPDSYPSLSITTAGIQVQL